ncbi:MAG TPA: hypothetical protein ENK93_01405 [Campylobacteraceae bacterium]|jgi:hypothetical protein|nr:hypothetical protein [Campylobacteraceae bacterium]
MTYLIEILTEEKKKQTFRVEAGSETEAKERLKLRLPPHKRESFTIASMKIDMSTVSDEDPYGVFGGE